MHANYMLEFWDKVIDAFKNGIFLSEHLKTSDDAAHDLVLEDVIILFRILNWWQKKLI